MVRISRLFGFTCFPLKGQGGLASALKLHVEAFGIVLTGHEVPAKHLGGNTKRAAAIEWVDDDSTGRNGVINERCDDLKWLLGRVNSFAVFIGHFDHTAYQARPSDRKSTRLNSSH